MVRIISLLLPWLLIAVVHAETVYVQSAKAPLLANNDFAAEQLLVLDKGAELTVLASEKRWLQVSFGDLQGWVSVLLVRDTPPLQKVDILGSESMSLEGEARIRASAVATAGATRGLAADDSEQGVQSDYRELSDMEALTISDEEIIEFTSELEGSQ